MTTLTRTMWTWMTTPTVTVMAVSRLSAQMVVTRVLVDHEGGFSSHGELARVVPIPGGANSRALGGEEKDAGLLDPSQLKAAGEHLLRTLLVMKHNGAIEKTRVGLTSLGERLLRSSQRDLSGLPATWLDDLFRRLEREGQSIKDLIRRSAGIPFGFMAVFLAEPGGVPRQLLHSAMAKLMDIAVRARARDETRGRLRSSFSLSLLSLSSLARSSLFAAATDGKDETQAPSTDQTVRDDRRLNRTTITLARTEPFAAAATTSASPGTNDDARTVRNAEPLTSSISPLSPRSRRRRTTAIACVRVASRAGRF